MPTPVSSGLTVDPPVETAYQSTVSPALTVAVAVKVCAGAHNPSAWSPPLVGATGKA